MDSIASAVAAKKLSNIKQNCKLKGFDPDQNTPESDQKFKEKVDKDLRKREEEKSKREDKYQERERQREKLRSRIRDKYDIPDPNKDEQPIEKKHSKLFKKKKKDLKEKDFYKYNKAMPEEKGKNKLNEKEQSLGTSSDFADQSAELAEQSTKDQKDCVIS